MIGISNVSPAQLELAAGIAPITSVQNEFSLFTRRDESNGLLATCERRGITYLAYSPLGGRGRAERLGQISALRRVARRHHATAQQVAIAWLLAKSPVLVPIPGSRRAKAVRETAAAGTLNLSASDLTEIEAVRTPLSWSAGAVAGRLVRKPGRAIDQGLQGIFRR
jgi:aryl-alcohol dehydrogenase-like predicted oxidoreductase